MPGNGNVSAISILFWGQRMIELSPWDLGLAASLMLLLALLSHRLQLKLAKPLLISTVRMVVQLSLIGLVLKVLFSTEQALWILLMAVAMLLVAGREVVARQHRRYRGWWAWGLGTGSMFLSSFTLTLMTLLVMIQADPWWNPQYAIPLLGMLLGNTMTAVTLTLERLTEGAWQQRERIEGRLALGQPWWVAIEDIRREAIRAGLMPIINSMAVAGLVSLPGMMTGQILAGAAPVTAVQYQILILLLIAAGTGLGCLAAMVWGSRRLFDERHRLRLDRLESPRS